MNERPHFTYPQSRLFGSIFCMRIEIVNEPITRAEAKEIAKEIYGHLVKGAADIDREVIALGGKWHMDANTKLIEFGSEQNSIWGFNLYPEKDGEERIEYLALINIRPGLGNRDMYIEDQVIREKIRAIIGRLVP